MINSILVCEWSPGNFLGDHFFYAELEPGNGKLDYNYLIIFEIYQNLLFWPRAGINI